MVTLEYDDDAMMKACEREAPREACGLVFPAGLTIEIDNIRSVPGQYVMNEGQFFIAVQEHGMFLAIWHTHPNGDVRPSPFDVEFHLRHYDDVHMIIATAKETAIYAHDS